MRNHLLTALFFLFIITGCQNKTDKTTAQTTPDSVWTAQKANDWYGDKGWLVGSNYTPAYAINQLEFWQADTFNPDSIDKELTLAEGLGMNTMRVYLHDLLYDQDADGFLKRMDTFLQIADKHHIKPMFVLFDSCWDPFPKSGKQREPKPHVHNSGWVQSPGLEVLKDSTQYPRLQKYVEGVVGKFANDDRILAWDIWNEPDNTNGSSYGKVELPNKSDYVTPLLTKAFIWARAAKASQPLTSAVWAGDWSTPDKLSPLQKVQIEQSDIISFHNYEKTQSLEKCINWLQQYNKPIICTEYMARPNGSTFESSLSVAKKYNVGMYNWGFVDGKTQTIYPWDSWKKQYDAEPPVWFHDIFRKDGTPYRKEETELIRKMTSTVNEAKS